jgi:hypothetical protein
VAPLSLLLGLALLLMLAPPAEAGWSNAPLTFGMDDQWPKIYQPVDHETWCLDCVGEGWTTQDPWVTNPTTCMWDTDDEFRYVSTGNVLAAGATVTVGGCLLKGEQLVRASTRISSPSPNLGVTYAFGSEATTAVPTFGADHRWHYDLCLAPGLFGGTPVEVADSHGGTAVPYDITVTVHNPTAQRVGKTGGAIAFGFQPYWAAGC